EGGKVRVAGRMDEFSCPRAFTAHAHVERPVEAERESATCRVEMHGGHSQIQHHSIDCVETRLARDCVEIGEPVLNQCQAPLELLHQVSTQGNGSLAA